MTTAHADNDNDLVRSARAGSLCEFEALVTRYQDRIFNYLLKRTGHRHEAEDLLQDTFVRAFRNLEKYDESYRFDSWLYTIAARLAINRRRIISREAVGIEPQKLSDLAGPAASGETGRCPDFWDKVRDVLDSRQFNVVWLRYVEGMTAGEIADVLGITGVNVRIILFRAHRRLKDVMERSDFTASPDDRVFMISRAEEVI